MNRENRRRRTRNSIYRVSPRKTLSRGACRNSDGSRDLRRIQVSAKIYQSNDTLHLRITVMRDSRHRRLTQDRERTVRKCLRNRKCLRIIDRTNRWERALYARWCGDRSRLDQGIHWDDRLFPLSRALSREEARTRLWALSRDSRWTSRPSREDIRYIGKCRIDQDYRSEIRTLYRLFLPRTRSRTRDRTRRITEIKRTLVYPLRGISSMRTETWTDRADR